MKTLENNVIPDNADNAIELLRSVPEMKSISQMAYIRCIEAIEDELKSLRLSEKNTMVWKD